MAKINRIDINISLEFEGMNITMRNLKSPNHPKGISYDIYTRNGTEGVQVTGKAFDYILTNFQKTDAHNEAVEIIEIAIK